MLLAMPLASLAMLPTMSRLPTMAGVRHRPMAIGRRPMAALLQLCGSDSRGGIPAIPPEPFTLFPPLASVKGIVLGYFHFTCVIIASRLHGRCRYRGYMWGARPGEYGAGAPPGVYGSPPHCRSSSHGCRPYGMLCLPAMPPMAGNCLHPHGCRLHSHRIYRPHRSTMVVPASI